VAVVDDVDCHWVDVTARDQHGLLAAVTGALADLDLEISHAIIATWPDRAALESFCVRSAQTLDPPRLRTAIESALDVDLGSPPLPEAHIAFDNHASPWHTACEIEAPDKPRLLHQLASAFAAADVDVVSATITGHDGRAYDSFLLDGRGGRKLDPADQATVARFVRDGVTTRHRWLRRPTYVASQN
jgi:UTP:GlnB (protein PII) uridylyltransferase